MPEQPLPRPQLLIKEELKAWLKVSDQWVKERLADAEFERQCVINLAPKTSPRRTLRFNAEAIAEWLSIPVPTPSPAPAVVESAAA